MNVGIFGWWRRRPAELVPDDLLYPDPGKPEFSKGPRPLELSPLNPILGPRKPKPPETSPQP